MMAESLDCQGDAGAEDPGAPGACLPGCRIALRFSNPLELLVATILSAQCTDERVNAVTETLFKGYRSAKDYADGDPATLERDIHATGFFKAKTRALIGMGRALVERHAGDVPRTLEELTALPGVGRKTANVVLGNAFGVPALAVDTHVFRVSQRLGLAEADDPDEVHDQLCQVIPRAAVDACHAPAHHSWPADVRRAASPIVLDVPSRRCARAREDEAGVQEVIDAPSFPFRYSPLPICLSRTRVRIFVGRP